jgi:hypothetical protein
LAICTASGAVRLNRAATDLAASSAFAASPRPSASPQSTASAPEIRRAVMSMSAARTVPISRGRRCVPPAAGQQAQRRFRQAELDVRLCDDQVTAQREFEASAERIAVDRGDERLVTVDDPLLDAIAEPHEVRVLHDRHIHVVLDVGTRGEGAAVAVKDADPRRGRFEEPGYVLIQQPEDDRAQRVELGRPVQGDVGDHAIFRVQDLWRWDVGLIRQQHGVPSHLLIVPLSRR